MTEENNLIKSLRAFPAGAVYSIGPKAFFLRGFEYYRRQRLKSYSWSGKETLLTAHVRGTRLYSVAFTAENGALFYSCDCPAWTASSHCKHVICALLTTVNLLSPHLFNTPGQTAERRKLLESGLLLKMQQIKVGPQAKNYDLREVVKISPNAQSYQGHASRADLLGGVPLGGRHGNHGVPFKVGPQAENYGVPFETPEIKTLEKKVEKRKLAPYEIVIEDKRVGSSLYIRRDGERIAAPWGVPAELGVFITQRSYPTRFISENLFRHFSRRGNAYPVIFVTDGAETPLTWNSSQKYEARTALNISSGQVEVRALCLLTEVVCEKARRLFGFVADLETKQLGVVEDTRGWDLYDHLEKVSERGDPPPDGDWKNQEQGAMEESIYLSNDQNDGTSRMRHHIPGNRSFQIPLRRFQSLQINLSEDQIKETLGRVMLQVDGLPAQIVQSEHTYRLTIDPAPDEESGRAGAPVCLLRAECRLGESVGTPTSPAFTFFTVLENHPSLSAALKAKKRKAVLHNAFFRLLSIRKKSDIEKAIRESLSGEDFSRSSVRSEAKSVLKYFVAHFSRPESRLRFDNEKWHLIPNDKSREALLYQIPFELFGSEIFKKTGNHHEMSLPAGALYEQLGLLYSRLTDSGISLFYKNKSVVTSQWDFSFDARRASGIDWFEIRPEIRCDGEIVDEALWLDLLQRGGVVEKEEFIQILDAGAQEVLKSISVIYRTAEKGNAVNFRLRAYFKEKQGKQDGRPRVKEIVRRPRLQILDWITLRKKGVKVRLSEEDEALIERLTHFDRIENVPLPKKLNAKLRPYQKEGYHWLAFLYQHRLGACLADDMGLGKTLQVITLLAGIKEGKIASFPNTTPTPHLVVLPPSLLFNWENEIARFYPGLKIHFYTGKERSTEFKGADVVMTTYALVRRDIEKLKEIPFHVIIFDEAQAVKNIYADTTGAVRRLKGYFKVVMTGTPLENHVGEYYSLIDLTLPGLLGEYDDFKSQIHLKISPSAKNYDPQGVVGGGNGNHGAPLKISPSAKIYGAPLDRSPLLDVILQRTRPFVLRRTKEKILKDLPPKIETDVYLDLTPKQKGLYQLTVSQIRSKIDDAYRSKTQAQAQIIALTAILKLRQLCVSPRLIASEIDDPSPKIDFLIGRLKELLEAGHSALVFSQFTSFLDILEAPLKDAVIPFLRLDGSTATVKRKKLVEGFQEGEKPAVFLLSLKAGGQGLNLTKASYVFHLDPWWNPAVENQASDRAHRIGQKNKVSIIRILMRHTIEEKMMELKKKKLALYKAVMEDDMKSGNKFSISRSDFDFLLES